MLAGLIIGSTCNASPQTGWSEDFGAQIREQGCGLISTYMALHLLGCDVPLSDLLKQTAWDSNPRPLSLYEICESINKQTGIHADGRILTVSAIADMLTDKNLAVILAIRKNNSAQTNHTVVACTCKDGIFTVYDYPELIVRMDQEALGRIFDGQAIVVRRARSHLPVIFLGLTAFFFLGCAGLVRWYYGNSPSDARDGVVSVSGGSAS